MTNSGSSNSIKTKDVRLRKKVTTSILAITGTGIVVAAVLIPMLTVPSGVQWWQNRKKEQEKTIQQDGPKNAVSFTESGADEVIVAEERWKGIGLDLKPVFANVPRRTLTMDGVLFLDPDDYSLLRTRFAGEIVEVTQVEDKTPHGIRPVNSQTRPIRFGDSIKKGQLLAVVWSRELGEKKSELAATLSRLAFDRDTLNRLTQARDSIPISTLREAERRVREEEIGVERIEKTLRAWQLSSTEVEQLVKELQSSSGKNPTPSEHAEQLSTDNVDHWARVEIRSPIDGTIVEKNITTGSLVDLNDILFRIADLSHLDARVFAFEEDLATLQRLPVESREWTIRLKGDTTSNTIAGSFDRIGSLIDPSQHTGLVMGWVDNSEKTLRPGQFVTATVTLPEDVPLVCVPATAVVDLDAKSFVLIQDQAHADRFSPTLVIVDRFQDGMACLRLPVKEGQSSGLTSTSVVVVQGAVEILAEYQMHRKSRGDTDKKTENEVRGTL